MPVSSLHQCAPTHAPLTQLQVESSSNVGGAWLAQLNGGLNYQIEHHLFPRIAHTYYPLIAPVVRDYCEKKGVKYVHFGNVVGNLRSTVSQL